MLKYFLIAAAIIIVIICVVVFKEFDEDHETPMFR